MAVQNMIDPAAAMGLRQKFNDRMQALRYAAMDNNDPASAVEMARSQFSTPAQDWAPLFESLRGKQTNYRSLDLPQDDNLANDANWNAMADPGESTPHRQRALGMALKGLAL